MDREILHCDCNAFFASVECVFNPDLKNVPMAVAGNPDDRHGIILAKTKLQRSSGSKQRKLYGRREKNVRDLCLSRRGMAHIRIFPKKSIIYICVIPIWWNLSV